MLRVAYEIIASGLKVLLVLAAFAFTSTAFADDDDPCSEENPCEEVVVTGTKPLPPQIENPLPIHSVNTTDPILPSVETDCIVEANGRGMTVDSDCDGNADSCGEGQVLRVIPRLGGSVCVLEEFPECSEEVENALIAGGVIGVLTERIVTKASEAADIKALTAANPSRFVKFVRIGAWWFLTIDLAAVAYCKLA